MEISDFYLDFLDLIGVGLTDFFGVGLAPSLACQLRSGLSSGLVVFIFLTILRM